MSKLKTRTIRIRRRDYAGGYTIWNVWSSGKIIAGLTTSEAAEEYVANRWYKISMDDHLRAASSDRDTYIRFLNANLAEIEARERPH